VKGRFTELLNEVRAKDQIDAMEGEVVERTRQVLLDDRDRVFSDGRGRTRSRVVEDLKESTACPNKYS